MRGVDSHARILVVKEWCCPRLALLHGPLRTRSLMALAPRIGKALHAATVQDRKQADLRAAVPARRYTLGVCHLVRPSAFASRCLVLVVITLVLASAALVQQLEVLAHLHRDAIQHELSDFVGL